MARKPAHILAKAGHHSPRQMIWQTIPRYGEFTVSGIVAVLDGKVSTNQVQEYLRALVNGGFLNARRPVKSFLPYIYTLINDVGVDAPKIRKDGSEVTQGKGRQTMYSAMRILVEFSIKDLLIQGEVAGLKIAKAEAQHYCRYLEKAGYIIPLTGGKPQRWLYNQASYKGHAAPLIQRVRQVFDPNINQVVWPLVEGGQDA